MLRVLQCYKLNWFNLHPVHFSFVTRSTFQNVSTYMYLYKATLLLKLPIVKNEHNITQCDYDVDVCSWRKYWNFTILLLHSTVQLIFLNLSYTRWCISWKYRIVHVHAWRCESYLRMFNSTYLTCSTWSWEEKYHKYISKQPVLYCIFYKRILIILTIFRRFLTNFCTFPKIFRMCSEGRTNVSEHFSNFFEDSRSLPKIFEDDPKMFRLNIDKLRLI